MRLDAFLQSADVAGESTDNRDNVATKIEILSYSQRIYRTTQLANQPPKPVAATHGVLTIVKYVDAATPKLAQLLYKNKRVAEMVLTVRGMATPNTPLNAVDDNLLKITIKQVLPTRLHHVANPRAHLFGKQLETRRPILSETALESGPLEEVDLHYFESIKWEYGNAQYEWTDPDHH